MVSGGDASLAGYFNAGQCIVYQAALLKGAQKKSIVSGYIFCLKQENSYLWKYAPQSSVAATAHYRVHLGLCHLTYFHLK